MPVGRGNISNWSISQGKLFLRPITIRLDGGVVVVVVQDCVAMWLLVDLVDDLLVAMLELAVWYQCFEIEKVGDRDSKNE